MYHTNISISAIYQTKLVTVYFIINYVLITETHAIAVVKTKEEYEGLRSALRNVARDVNSLNKVGKISVDGTEIPLEFFLGGDYKVSFKYKCVCVYILDILTN